jgi:hypothetical protein
VHIDYHHVEEVLGEPYQDSIVQRSVHLNAIHFLNLGLLRKQLLLYELLQVLLGDEILHSFPLTHEVFLYPGILKLISYLGVLFRKFLSEILSILPTFLVAQRGLGDVGTFLRLLVLLIFVSFLAILLLIISRITISFLSFSVSNPMFLDEVQD